jgi:hypothetical protein
MEEDKYSVIQGWDMGKLCVKYLCNGVPHRIGKPAVFWYAGFVQDNCKVAYYENGLLHRKNNMPAVLEEKNLYWNDEGKCKWYIHGVKQKEPCVISDEIKNEIDQVRNMVNNETNQYSDWSSNI